MLSLFKTIHSNFYLLLPGHLNTYQQSRNFFRKEILILPPLKIGEDDMDLIHSTDNWKVLFYERGLKFS